MISPMPIQCTVSHGNRLVLAIAHSRLFRIGTADDEAKGKRQKESPNFETFLLPSAFCLQVLKEFD